MQTSIIKDLERLLTLYETIYGKDDEEGIKLREQNLHLIASLNDGAPDVNRRVSTVIDALDAALKTNNLTLMRIMALAVHGAEIRTQLDQARSLLRLQKQGKIPAP